MEQPRRAACTLTLAAMLSPWGAVVCNLVHVAIDAHHHEPAPAGDDHRDDADAILHGHQHAEGTPPHSHDTAIAAASPQLSAPPMAAHPSAPASTIAMATACGSLLPRFAPSPPQLVPVILRI